MLHVRVNDTEMVYLELGQGAPLVLVHGSMCDFRIWSPVLGPLSRQHRVIAPSLRHFFPARWDGQGATYKIAQHVADMIAFIEALKCGPVQLLGQSRGGHIAFRVAQQRPDLVAKLVLAEPGGELAASLAPEGMPPGPQGAILREAAAKVAAGDIDGGLMQFVDGINFAGLWQRLPEAMKQETRDNAMTLVGQADEGRRPFTRAEAESIRMPTLFIGGAETKGGLPIILRALAAHVPGARLEMIDKAGHMMFVQNPVRFSEIVNAFLGGRG